MPLFNAISPVGRFIFESSFVDLTLPQKRLRLVHDHQYGYNYNIEQFGVEFEYDKRDGKLKFIEINPSSVIWYSFFEASYMELPWLMFQDMVMGNKITKSYHEVNTL